jgi:hypothetical protein
MDMCMDAYLYTYTTHPFLQETPVSFIYDLEVHTALDKKALKFTYSRLNSLLRTLQITSLEEFNPLQDVANFATLVATYTDGFAVILEPQGSMIAGIQEPLLQLCCLDASIAIQPVFKRFQSVVITSGNEMRGIDGWNEEDEEEKGHWRASGCLHTAGSI